MATIKFNYGGVDYHLVAYSNKITTPSIKIGSVYIPCFAGNIGQEIISGDKIFTLSPMNVGNYRAVCGARQGFVGGVFITVHQRSSIGNWGGISMSSFSASITNAYTNQSGFTASVNVTSSDAGGNAISTSYTYRFAGTYSVVDASTGIVAKTGNFNVSVTHNHTSAYGIVEEKDYTVQIA